MDTILDVIGSSEVAVLFVEHDMDVIEHYASRVVAFSEGKIIADGVPGDVMNDSMVRGLVVGSGPEKKPS